MMTIPKTRLSNRFAIFLMAVPCVLNARSTPPNPNNIVTARPATSRPLPPYVVYRHFLAWVVQLDNAATAAGATDPYQFADPFSRAGLRHQHIDILRAEAHLLDSDLQTHQARAKLIVAKYRSDASALLSTGQSLPAAPQAIRDLQKQKTALLVNHYAKLRAALGPDVSAQLDSYLNYEFAPHITLQRMSASGKPVAH